MVQLAASPPRIFRFKHHRDRISPRRRVSMGCFGRSSPWARHCSRRVGVRSRVSGRGVARSGTRRSVRPSRPERPARDGQADFGAVAGGEILQIVEKLQRTFRRRHETDDQTGPMEESRVIRARGGHSRDGDQAARRTGGGRVPRLLINTEVSEHATRTHHDRRASASWHGPRVDAPRARASDFEGAVHLPSCPRGQPAATRPGNGPDDAGAGPDVADDGPGSGGDARHSARSTATVAPRSRCEGQRVLDLG